MTLHDDLSSLLSMAGFHLGEQQLDLLTTFGEWLADEAVPAGGIGPAEVDRIADRHLLDSLSFAHVFEQHHHRPTTILDLGSGVGLPGIPLAIIYPDVPVILLDRSARRIGLAQRALRILELTNVATQQMEFSQSTLDRFSTVVSRASLPPEALLPHVERHVSPSGLGVVAASVRNRTEHLPFSTFHLDLQILDLHRWFLIMAPQQP